VNLGLVTQWLAAGLALASAGAMLARLGWPFELLSHFRSQYAAAAIVIATLSAATSDWITGAVSLGIGLWAMLGLVTRKFEQVDTTPRSSPGLTIAWANVWKKPEALERTVAWASGHGAAVILFGEFPPQRDIAEGFADDYPHRLATAVNDGLGFSTRVAVLSRLPLLNTEVMAPVGRHDRPFLRLAVEIAPGRQVNILAIHPDAPATPGMLRDRDALIMRLGDLVQAPFLIAGDFNATPWCPVFRLIPGRRIGAAARRPTWLTGIPLLGLPIDHISVSPGVRASRYAVAPFLGSDHRAILARVHLVSEPG
jgi:endonuclease/exonuclease/phosphatase (EEP) superfamily protein YafD